MITEEEIAAQIQAGVERFARLVVVELSKVRAGATIAELCRAFDNAMRRYKFDQQ